jgi:hypothetical protein
MLLAPPHPPACAFFPHMAVLPGMPKYLSDYFDPPGRQLASLRRSDDFLGGYEP